MYTILDLPTELITEHILYYDKIQYLLYTCSDMYNIQSVYKYRIKCKYPYLFNIFNNKNLYINYFKLWKELKYINDIFIELMENKNELKKYITNSYIKINYDIFILSDISEIKNSLEYIKLLLSIALEYKYYEVIYVLINNKILLKDINIINIYCDLDDIFKLNDKIIHSIQNNISINTHNVYIKKNIKNYIDNLHVKYNYNYRHFECIYVNKVINPFYQYSMNQCIKHKMFKSMYIFSLSNNIEYNIKINVVKFLIKHKQNKTLENIIKYHMKSHFIKSYELFIVKNDSVDILDTLLYYSQKQNYKINIEHIFYKSCEFGSYNVVLFLLNKYDINKLEANKLKPNSRNNYSLRMACFNNHIDIIKLLLNTNFYNISIYKNELIKANIYKSLYTDLITLLEQKILEYK